MPIVTSDTELLQMETAPVPEGKTRYACRLLPHVKGEPTKTHKVYALSLAGVSFERHSLTVFPREMDRAPQGQIPTHDLTPTQVEAINHILEHGVIRNGIEIIKPRRRPVTPENKTPAAINEFDPDWHLYRLPTDVPLGDIVQFTPAAQAGDTARLIELEGQVAELRAQLAAEGAKTAAQSAADEAEDAKDEAIKNTQAIAGKTRTAGPRNRRGKA